MAAYDFAPASMAEMFSQIASFADNSLGWTASFSGGVATIQPAGSTATYTLQEGIWRYSNIRSVLMDLTDGADVITSAMSHMTDLLRVWLHGSNSPEPWLLISVMVEPGVYRHAFIGNAVKYGTWGGGALIDGVYFGTSSSNPELSSYAHNFDSNASHMLFSSNTMTNNTNSPREVPGGVIIRGQHGAFEKAHFQASGYTATFPDDHPRAGGGFVDEYATAAARPGFMPISGEAALVPVTLFADMLRNNTWTPIGYVPGIRMINITNFEPEQSYPFAGQTWRVFPLARKSAGLHYNTGWRGVAVMAD